MMKKICTRCKIEKSLDDFTKIKAASKSKNSKSKGRCSWCRSCLAYEKNKYYINNRSKFLKRTREWRDKNKKKYLQYMMARYRENPFRSKDLNLRRLYGITLGQFDKMLIDQGFTCPICLDGGGPYQIEMVVDHCHRTKRVLGLLCHRCNQSIGLLKDSPENAIRLAEYLTRSIKQ